jgi:hypothetical protein
MSWTPITPIDTRIRHVVKAKLRVSAQKQNAKRFLSVIIFPEKIDEVLAWWKPGARVDAFIGQDTHTGRIKIEVKSAGPHRLSKTNGTGTACCLRVPVFEWIDAEAHETELVGLDYDGSWLEIQLPEWARKPVAVSAYDLGKQLAEKPFAPVWELEKAFAGRPEPIVDPTAPIVVAPKPAQKKGFQMSAMEGPDPMVEAKIANVRQP